ncbi:MAG TPA: 50S ribosomal protein L40e [Candidatus Lokiarchaeia archaeon]|nr:50S ribosomal protein L40e [Candidatus Lokiarchaeia archaeon]
MPLADPIKKKIASQHLLYHLICRKCGARNNFHAKKCRRCHSTNLRQKKREASK